MERTRTAASFRWAGTPIWARLSTILKVYKILGTLQIKVSEIKGKAFKVKGLRFKNLTIKVRKQQGLAGASEDISAALLRKIGGNGSCGPGLV